MANVFLSYDHEDSALATKLVQLLEKAGHTVWFDRQIHGGAQYNREIENAVESAEVLVVLWSARSVESAWVRDEAAAGRDAGKLVPVALDKTKPPMGFRQYQTIDLSSWKGSARAAALPELLRAIDQVSGSPSPAPEGAARGQASSGGPRGGVKLALAAVAALVLAAAAYLLWQGLGRGGGAPVVAVTPATQEPAARLLARDLLVQLGSLQSAASGTLQLTDHQSGTSPDLLFEVGGAADPRQPSANLVLFNGKDRELLWSKEFQPQTGKLADLKQQMGFTAAQVLQCAFEGIAETRKRLDVQILKTYLTGCSALSQADSAETRDLIATFRRIVIRAPEFPGGWAKLLLAQSNLMVASSKEEAAIRPQLRRDIERARRTDPDMPEAYQAEIDLLPYDAYGRRLELAERAVAANPTSALAFAARAQSLQLVGRINDSVDHARRARQLDPLSPSMRDLYIGTLAHAGRLDQAMQELGEADRLWPGASTLASVRFAINLRYGDAREALRFIRSGEIEAGWLRTTSYLEARTDPTPAKVNLAIADAVRAYRHHSGFLHHLVQVLATFGRHDQLLAILLSAPRRDVVDTMDAMFRARVVDVWRNPKSLVVAQRTGLLHYWRNSSQWPDFCNEPELPYDCKAEAAKYG